MTCVDDIRPFRASAPATMSVGTAGTGIPICSAKTLRKTSETPYRTR